jgi:hypothetical protein
MRDLEQRLIQAPADAETAEALRCLLRLRGEGKSAEEIAAGLAAAGHELSPAAVERVLREIAGPAAAGEGADPEYFSGYLGGG